MIFILRAIFGAIVCGDFLLAFLIWTVLLLLNASRNYKENAEIRKVLTGFPPARKTVENKLSDEDARRAAAERDAFSKMMGYSVETAYGMNRDERIT